MHHGIQKPRGQSFGVNFDRRKTNGVGSDVNSYPVTNIISHSMILEAASDKFSQIALMHKTGRPTGALWSIQGLKHGAPY